LICLSLSGKEEKMHRVVYQESGRAMDQDHI
jgi:hypothetical protein